MLPETFSQASGNLYIQFSRNVYTIQSKRMDDSAETYGRFSSL